MTKQQRKAEALSRAYSAAWEAWYWSKGGWDEDECYELVGALRARLSRVQREVMRSDRRAA